MTFAARGAHLEAIREQGLTIRSAVEGEWTVHANAVELGVRYDVPTPTLFAVYAAPAPYLNGTPQGGGTSS